MSEKKYTVSEGRKSFYLMSPNGFCLAESAGMEGSDLQEIADKLNRLGALERSHAELVEILLEARSGLAAHCGLATEETIDKADAALRNAQSLTSTNKTPTTPILGQ